MWFRSCWLFAVRLFRSRCTGSEREHSDTYRVLTTTAANAANSLLGEPLHTGVSDPGTLLTGAAVGVGPGPSGNGNGRYLSHGNGAAGGVGDHQKWDIDPREIKFGADIKEESGISFSQRYGLGWVWVGLDRAGERAIRSSDPVLICDGL